MYDLESVSTGKGIGDESHCRVQKKSSFKGAENGGYETDDGPDQGDLIQYSESADPGREVSRSFSGSGGIGIEALSRGASKAVFVEKNLEAASVIRDNLKFTKLSDVGELIRKDVLSAITELEERHETFDVVFMDPPYGTGLDLETLGRLHHSSVIDAHTLLITEASIDADPAAYSSIGYRIERDKRYKTNRHFFMRLISFDEKDHKNGRE